MEHNHCWHDTDNVLASNPQQYELMCCQCGEVNRVSKDYMQSVKFKGYTPGVRHGEFASGLPMKSRGFFMTEPTQPAMPQEPPTEEDKARAEFERLLVLTKLPEQDRIAQCDKELAIVLAKWRCTLAVHVQLINGIPQYSVGIQTVKL